MAASDRGKRQNWPAGFAVALFAVAVMALGRIWFVRASDDARRSGCQANLKSIALGLRQYMQDNNHKLPPVQGDGHPRSPHFGWVGCSQRYLRSIQILQCPAEPKTGVNLGLPQIGVTDYWFNGLLSGLSETELNYPSNTMMIGDGASGTAVYGVFGKNPAWSDTAAYASRHCGGANFAFVDGHVKWLKPFWGSSVHIEVGVFTFHP